MSAQTGAEKYADFHDEAVGRIARALLLGLDAARDTSVYRWPQQEDVPPLVRRILDDLIEGGFVIAPANSHSPRSVANDDSGASGEAGR